MSATRLIDARNLEPGQILVVPGTEPPRRLLVVRVRQVQIEIPGCGWVRGTEILHREASQNAHTAMRTFPILCKVEVET